MIKKKEDHHEPLVIDLTGPGGNAFALMGNAQAWYRQMGKSKEETQKLIEEMTSWDYENLVNIMDREFGSVVTFLR